MKKNDYTTVTLTTGKVHIYDFGEVKLHAYQTDDFLADEVFVLVKGSNAVVIESPCFTDSIRALTDYIGTLGVRVAGKLLAYHMAGATFLPNVPVYTTKNADEYVREGGGKALIDSFTGAFGEVFDNSIHAVTNFIEAGSVTIGGIEMNILPTADAFDIEIPEINAVYLHMMGHDCHSIVAGEPHADALIAQLNQFAERGFDLILTSHYTPEDLKDAQTKADYLNDLKTIAKSSGNAGEFQAAVAAKYPNYSGENYLEMTTGFFFPA
ncbi:MAG: hypothetical protein ACK5LX_01500 [Oscillospiraceae bacterium]